MTSDQTSSPPQIFYKGKFDFNTIKKIKENGNELLIRSDYSKVCPDIILSQFKTPVKINRKRQKEIIKLCDLFVEEKYEEIYEQVVNDFFLKGNFEDFPSFISEFMESHQEEYYTEFFVTRKVEEIEYDYCRNILKKKIGFKIKDMIES